jgi:hypothetical protein
MTMAEAQGATPAGSNSVPSGAVVPSQPPTAAQAPTSGSPPVAATSPGLVTRLWTSPHRVYSLISKNDRLFWTHENDRKGAKSDGSSMSTASVTGGPATLLMEEGPNSGPGSIAATGQWLYVTKELAFWDSAGSLWRSPIDGGARAELSTGLADNLVATDGVAAWTENVPGEQRKAVKSIANGEAVARTIATLDGSFTLTAMSADELYFTRITVEKSQSKQSLHALSLKDARERVILPDMPHGTVALVDKELLMNKRGELVAVKLRGGATRVLLGRGGSCGADRFGGFAAAEGFAYWMDSGQLKRCRIEGGKAEVLVGLPSGASSIVAGSGHVAILASGALPEASSIYVYRLAGK